MDIQQAIINIQREKHPGWIKSLLAEVLVFLLAVSLLFGGFWIGLALLNVCAALLFLSLVTLPWCLKFFPDAYEHFMPSPFWMDLVVVISSSLLTIFAFYVGQYFIAITMITYFIVHCTKLYSLKLQNRQISHEIFNNYLAQIKKNDQTLEDNAQAHSSTEQK